VIGERRRFGPVAGPPSKTVTARDGERFLVPPTLSAEDAEDLARRRIQEGLARPADSHRAEIESAHLVWVPLWRVDAAVDGHHFALRALRDKQGGLRAVLPTGGARHHDEVRVILARHLLPVDPSPRVTLDPTELTPFAGVIPAEGEWIDADVARDEAEFEVARALRQRVRPARAIYADYEVRVRSAALVHLAVWLRRYRYEGEAAGGRVDECHVALHGRTGQVVSERHPAVWRALAGRLTRLLRRG
jgi:hypothetical protein